jgi:N6-adenosine-specific RNA methylase IME4
MRWPFNELRPLSADLIVADPPWDFALYSAKGEAKSEKRHYRTMPLAAIKALPIGHLARGDCLLLLWGRLCMLPEAIETVGAWGFTYRSALVWQKVTRLGRPSIGTGYRVRSMAEIVLVATVGAPRHKPFPGLFPGERREHSRKPDSFYELVDKCAPDLVWRLDLFSRQTRPGWQAWGDESTKFDAVPAPALEISGGLA